MKYKNIFTVAVLLAVALCISGCSQKADVSKKEPPKKTAESTTESDTEDWRKTLTDKADSKTVIWSVPDYGAPKKQNVSLLNKKLKEDGHDFRVEFQEIDGEKYNEVIETVLKEGKTDIAFGGTDDEKTGGIVAKLCRDGCFAALDDYLASKEGEALKNSCNEVRWKEVECDGHIYTVPNSLFTDGANYVVFNTDYVDRKKAEAFNGDINTLGEYVSGKKMSGDFLPIAFMSDLDEYAATKGYHMMSGNVFMDCRNGKVYSPFELPEIQKLEKTLWKWNRKGYINPGLSLSGGEGTSGTDEKSSSEYVENGQYGVYVGPYIRDFEKEKEHLVVSPLPVWILPSRMSSTTGINAVSEKKEPSQELLSLLHTDSGYANLLVYGEEGKDYEVKEGHAVCNEDSGLAFDVLGIWANILPEEDDRTVLCGKKEDREELYRSERVNISGYAGFQPDVYDLSERLSKLEEYIQYHIDTWKKEDPKEEYPEKEFEANFEKTAKKMKKESGFIKKELEKQRCEWEAEK